MHRFLSYLWFPKLKEFCFLIVMESLGNVVLSWDNVHLICFSFVMTTSNHHCEYYNTLESLLPLFGSITMKCSELLETPFLRKYVVICFFSKYAFLISFVFFKDASLKVPFAKLGVLQWNVAFKWSLTEEYVVRCLFTKYVFLISSSVFSKMIP